ncbi:unnamed protein product [Closterium sp. Yama58-4]|nr:unnamed protein product [Closterium sp. Yama58-4]
MMPKEAIPLLSAIKIPEPTPRPTRFMTKSDGPQRVKCDDVSTMDGAGENAGNDGGNGGAVKEDEGGKQWSDVDLKDEGDALQQEGTKAEIALNVENPVGAEVVELHAAGVNVAAAEAGSDAAAEGPEPEVEVQPVAEQVEQGSKSASSGARIHGMQTRAMASASHAGNSNPLPPLSGSASKRSREEEETDGIITAVLPVEEMLPSPSESGGFPKKKLWDQLRSMRISTPRSTRAKSRVSKAPPSSRPTGLTVPQPFNLRTDVRSRPGEAKLKNDVRHSQTYCLYCSSLPTLRAQPFVSLAQSVQAFARSSRSSDAEVRNTTQLAMYLLHVFPSPSDFPPALTSYLMSSSASVSLCRSLCQAGTAHKSRPGVSAVPAAAAAAEPHLTVPQPFVFNTEKRRGSQNEKIKEVKPFVSLAQSVSMFGIRSNRSSEVESSSHMSGTTHELGLTIPEPFDFKTDRRLRPKDEQLKKEAKPFVSLAQSVSTFSARNDHRSSETEHKVHESGPSHGATLTVPEPFDFKTDRRLRPKDEQLKKEAKPFVSLAESVSMFGARSSRSSAGTESQAHDGGPSHGAALTIPEPFDLKTDRRQRPKDEQLKKEAKPFVSLAQELSAFSAHMRPAGEAPSAPAAASSGASDAPRVTKPVTPKLLTAQRERPRRFRVLQEGEAAGCGVTTRSASKRGATAAPAAGGAGGDAAGPRLPTVPCSPMLTTKLRARVAKVKSSEERELEEMATAAKRMHTGMHGSSEVLGAVFHAS